jgi:peptide deformylase
MALRKIVVEGEDDCLNRVCRPVTEFNPHLNQLLDDLTETLRDANGAGLAAPQVGVLRRVCVVLDESTEQILELINPEILDESGEQTGLEGCLSIPGRYAIVTRPNHVRIRAVNRVGKSFEMEREGLTARAFCHEIEHLDGHLFTEHVEHLLSDEELQKYLEKEEEK